MAQSIKNLALGSQLKDDKGVIYTVVAKDHYMTNEVTLKANVRISKQIQVNTNVVDYGTSDVNYWLNTEFPSLVATGLTEYINTTKLPYCDVHTQFYSDLKYVDVKFFLPALKELGIQYANTPEANASLIKHMPYFNSNTTRVHASRYWTRTEYQPNTPSESQGMYYTMQEIGEVYYPTSANAVYEITPFFNVNASLLVSDSIIGGYYGFIFNNPPVISTISNIDGKYNSATTIEYTATDVDDSALTHYFSVDNGITWQEIKPSKINNRYTYQHVFSKLENYNCRVKVVDSANNQSVSNMFIVSVNSANPVVNIVSVIDRVVTFKASCLTEAITKVEVLVNGVVRHTFNIGFDFNLVYEIDRTHLNTGSNTIQIKATSSAAMVGTRGLEANKKAYSMPPTGTRVVIDGQDYSILSATQNGSNHTYTLDKNLVSSVNAGSLVQVLQDYVNIKCALSSTSTDKEYQNMKLVKTKVLKGDFEGYVEEKYELNGEGRYSTIMLELQRFNNDVASELIELQQAFDYLED